MKYAHILVALILSLSCAAAEAPAGQESTSQSGGARVAPLSIDEVLRAALLNNPEVRAAVRRVSLAESKVSGAGTLDDPMAMYRDWGTPLRRPWDLNQAQHMFMLQQSWSWRQRGAMSPWRSARRSWTFCATTTSAGFTTSR
jgi:hypothetical protein